MSDQQLRKAVIRLAAAKPELRGHLIPMLRTAAPRQQKYLGVNVTPRDVRLLLFWEDIFKAVSEYWSLTIDPDRPKPNHIFFQATGPFGTGIRVLIDGPMDAEYVDIRLTLYVKAGALWDPIEKQTKRFGTMRSIKEMVQWIDLTAVTWAKGAGLDQR